MMIQKVSMIGHAEHQQRDRDLGRAEDGQHRQRVANGEHAGRTDEHPRRMEVVRQEAEQRAGEQRAQHRDQRLVGSARPAR